MQKLVLGLTLAAATGFGAVTLALNPNLASGWPSEPSWDRSDRRQISAPSPAVPDCRIKGNISFYSGERIYHLPGHRWYDETEIDPLNGEHWFRSEAEANLEIKVERLACRLG